MNLHKQLFINLRVSYRVFFVFVNPLSFAFYLLFPKERKILKLRSPIGKINLVLINRQSARTIY